MILTLACVPIARSQQQFAAKDGKATADFEACPAADGAAEDPTYPIRREAFEADTAGRHDEARHLMRCAIRANPKDLVALRQEVYLDLNANDAKGAAEDIDALRSLHASSPQFEAQQGYIFAKEKKYDEARTAFGRAIAGGDPVIAAQSMAAVKVLDGEFPRHVVTLSLDGQYLHRFDDGIVDASAKYMERLGRNSPVQAYVGARLLRDTASNGGALPQIFSDNALLTGVGVAFHPHDSPFVVTAEMNEAYLPYGSRSGTTALVPDTRVVAGYYRTWRGSTDGAFSNRWALEANGSFGFYSRYQHDGIAYLQPRESYDLTRQGTLRLTPFFEQSIALDTNRQFYNNAIELIPGFEASDTRLHGLALRVEYARGEYLPGSGATTNPYGSGYNDVRFRLVYQKSFAFGTGVR